MLGHLCVGMTKSLWPSLQTYPSLLLNPVFHFSFHFSFGKLCRIQHPSSYKHPVLPVPWLHSTLVNLCYSLQDYPASTQTGDQPASATSLKILQHFFCLFYWVPFNPTEWSNSPHRWGEKGAISRQQNRCLKILRKLVITNGPNHGTVFSTGVYIHLKK